MYVHVHVHVSVHLQFSFIFIWLLLFNLFLLVFFGSVYHLAILIFVPFCIKHCRHSSERNLHFTSRCTAAITGRKEET